MAARKEIPRELSIYINDKEVVNSFRGITAEISKTNNEIKNLNKNSATYNDDLARLKGNLNTLTEKQTEFKNEIKGTSEAMDDGAGSFAKFRDGLLSGDFKSAKEGLMGIRGEMANLVKTSLAFLATPIGAAIAALAGIAYVTKQWLDYNESIQENTRLIENLTGKTGQAVADIRNNIQGLADTFGLEFEGLAGAVDNLMDTGVAKDELEALEKIKNGLLTAPNSTEFIASLESTALIAKQVGINLEDVIALKQEIEDTGIDPEKVFGALQKATIKLASQSDSLKQKLSDALGAAFTDDVLAKIKSGEITTVQALQAIGKKSQEVGLNQKQQAELTTEIFGKAGIAAGGLLSITQTLTNAQVRQNKALTPLQKATEDLAKSNIELAKAQDDALRSDGYAIWKKNAMIALNTVKKGFLDLVGWITNSEEALRKTSLRNAKNGGIADGSKAFSNQFKNLSGTGSDAEIAASIKSVAERNYKMYEKEAIELDKKTRELAKNLSSKSDQDYFIIKGVDPKRKEELTKSLNEQAEIIRQARDKINKINEKPTPNTKKTADEIRELKEAEDEKLKVITDANNKKEEEATRIEEAKKKAFKDGEDAIDELLFRTQQERGIANLSGLQKEIAQVTAKYAVEIEKFKEHKSRLKEIEKARDQEINDLKIAKAQEYNVQILDIEKQLAFDKEVFRLDQEAQKATTDQEKQAILIEKAHFIADYEIQTDLEKELAKVENVENAEALKQAIRDKYAQKKAEVDNKMDVAEKAIKSDQVKWTELTEAQKLNVIRDSLNGASEAFNKGSNAWKAIKIAETSIATYQSAVSAYGALAGIPIVGPALGAAAAALAVVAGLKQVKSIASTKIEKAPKLFYGGDTGSTPHFGYDEFGAMTGITHDHEYVIPKSMTQSPRYANTIAWLEQERTGKSTRKFADGGGTSPNAVPDVVMTENNSRMELLLQAVLHRLENPIAPNLMVGYDDAKAIQDLNDERASSDQNSTVSS
jgi:hypothetical protein